MARMVVKTARMAALLLLLLVAGCFTSDVPLLTDEDAVMPLPDHALVAELDDSGTSVKRDSKGRPDIVEIIKAGRHYIERDAEDARRAPKPSHVTLTFADLGQGAPVFLLQEVLKDGDPKASQKPMIISYVVVKYLDDMLVVYTPPRPGTSPLDAALKRAGIEYKRSKNELGFQFSDKQQLLAAGRIYASRLIAGHVGRFRVAHTAEAIAALRQELGQAHSTATQSPPAGGASAAAAPPPVAPSQDAAAAMPNACDQQAADPKDPQRLAPGVRAEAIVPALALQACERAVAFYPSSGRLRYQLGRAQLASRNIAAASASYRQADAMGYPMAWYSLGIDYANGFGVPVDYGKAEAYLRRAIAAGIDAKSELQGLVFTSDGYSNPAFFDAIFAGQVSSSQAKSASVYLGEFMQVFHNTPDCRNVISLYALSKLLQAETFGTLGQMFGALRNADRSYRPGDFGAAARSGWNAGMSSTNGLMLQVSKAQEDAQLFYERHGCHSPVARQFFKNIEALALGS